MSSTPYDLVQNEREAELTQALAHQVGQIELAAYVAERGMAQIAQTHEDVSQLCEATLVLVDRMLRDARQTNRLSPFQEAALQHIRMAYLFEMLAEAERTGNRMTDVMGR